MPLVRFTGQVLPSAINVTINHSSQIQWDYPELGLEMSFKLHIRNSAVEVECETNRFQHDEVVHYWMRALDLARASVDLVAFAEGYGLTVILYTLIRPNGVRSVMLGRDDRLAPLCTAFSVNSDDPEKNAEFDRVYQLVLSE